MSEFAATAAPHEATATERVLHRLTGLDIARALAIFGMVIVNYRSTFHETGEAPPWLETLANQVNGRAAATFVFLAGIGIALLSRKSRTSGDKDLIREDRRDLFRRALFLLAIGFLFRQVWEYDILHFYGAWLIMAAVVLTVRSVWLIAIALLMVAIFPFLYFLLPDALGITFWDTTNAFTWRDIAIDYFFQGYHPIAPWFAFMCIGMAVGRLDLADVKIRRNLLIAGIAMIAIGEGLAGVMLDLGYFKLLEDIFPTLDLNEANPIIDTDSYPPMPLFVLVGTGWAMTIVSLCFGFGLRFGDRRWITPFVHTGQLALTIYILHGTFGVWAVGWAGYKPYQSLEWILTYCVIFYLFAILFATLWRRRYSRGPVEAIMRRLTDRWESEINPVKPASEA